MRKIPPFMRRMRKRGTAGEWLNLMPEAFSGFRHAVLAQHGRITLREHRHIGLRI